MLHISPIGANQTELTFNGAKVLFSYQTPVAAWINGQFYKTNKKWSVTTSKHVNKWVSSDNSLILLAIEKDQSFFDGIIEKFNLEGVL